MCDPLTMAAAAVTAYGSYKQGQAQQDIANYNARTAELAAEDAVARGTQSADAQRNKVRQILGTQRAMMGATGAEVGAGTLGKVLDQTATYGELDARTIEANAQREAWGMRTQAAGTRAQGDLAAAAGTMGALGSLLTGGAQAYGIYRKVK